MGHFIATTGTYAFSARTEATAAHPATAAAASKASSRSRSLPSGACSISSRHLNRLLSDFICIVSLGLCAFVAE